MVTAMLGDSVRSRCHTGTPSGAATGPVCLAGAVSLSASGLGFVAGYGADAFFNFVDALLMHIFGLDKRGK